MKKQRTIETALEALKVFGMEPDNVEILVIIRTADDVTHGIKGNWYKKGIVEWLEEQADSIEIELDDDKAKIRATIPCLLNERSTTSQA